MKNKSIGVLFTLALLIAGLGCSDKSTEAPSCPQCWDEKMECVEGQCTCPEQFIVTWMELNTNPEQVQSRSYCIAPDKLTFLAQIPDFGCVDTFAITFLTEPLEVTEQTPMLEYTSVIPEVPESWRALPPGLVLELRENAYPDVTISSLYPTKGSSYVSCFDFDADGQLVGSISNINFYGAFVHPDTIAGFLQLEDASGTLSNFDGQRMNDVKLVRTVPY